MNIQQGLLVSPDYPSHVPLLRLPLRRSEEAIRLLISSGSTVGLSVALTSNGVLKSVALATTAQICLLYIDNATRGAQSKIFDTKLGALLGGSYSPVVGFEMAKLALYIHHELKYRTSGIDLSTLLSASTRRPLTENSVVSRVFGGSVSARDSRIWALAEEDGDAITNVCLRAWISASVALHCSTEIKAARRVDTIHLRSKVSVHLKTSCGREYIGQATSAEGKQTVIKLDAGRLSGAVDTVYMSGREEMTAAERAQDEFVLLVLRGERVIHRSPIVRWVWFPDEHAMKPKPQIEAPSASTPGMQNLNESQRLVVAAMTSPRPLLVLTHGPPGTGKTTTISAAVKIWEQSNKPVWIVAQSNVAVKNIAESLLKRDVDFILMVSKEFYVEWHEHIYEKMVPHLLRTDDIVVDDLYALERRVGTKCVVLCTLSLLSNPILQDSGFFELIPVERLVVDEASQLDVFEYMSDQVTEDRMPIPISKFISDKVYDSKLRSEHSISGMSCLSFVDVGKGREEQSGLSWKNMDEVHTIVNLIRNYYRLADFCVITPYDAQRAALETQLKAENLPWERVFNVDSFQGSDYHPAHLLLYN
ncbi:hypothetical protein PLICRDRAFT_32539 [Plicaturopsis crispa FD-325 SS-3]|uniref:DNA2/NAM7 helicase-like C-terminal domain-containing protein n=1 Tax=Plicaturopsis crispa FD-325 SS-3 TaxID=944288 RepID=A0A0C9SQW8_PLICR|nr:hypothetical protein PLICRDRAFT_32539 [Plicaturopsis crispa FD-325 SS-3]